MSFLTQAVPVNSLEVLRGGRPGFSGQIVPAASGGNGVSSLVGTTLQLDAPVNNQLNNAYPFLFLGVSGSGTLLQSTGGTVTCDNSAETTDRILSVMFSMYGTSGAGVDEFGLGFACPGGAGPNAPADTHVATASPFNFQLTGTYLVPAGQIATFNLRLTCGGANFAVSPTAANYFVFMVIQ